VEIIVTRHKSNDNETIGSMYIDNLFVCYTLEDEYRAKKVWGETRIPAGRYELELNNDFGKNKKYSKRFPDIHKGMIHLLNVPGFKYILIHIGNTDVDTAGCILVGMSANDTGKKWKISRSTDAYKKIYPIISEAIKNETVFITIEDGDR